METVRDWSITLTLVFVFTTFELTQKARKHTISTTSENGDTIAELTDPTTEDVGVQILDFEVSQLFVS